MPLCKIAVTQSKPILSQLETTLRLNPPQTLPSALETIIKAITTPTVTSLPSLTFREPGVDLTAARDAENVLFDHHSQDLERLVNEIRAQRLYGDVVKVVGALRSEEDGGEEASSSSSSTSTTTTTTTTTRVAALSTLFLLTMPRFLLACVGEGVRRVLEDARDEA
ncbi:hypothetical protein HDU67_010368, partial [Dinochytrium kinnereticum]